MDPSRNVEERDASGEVELLGEVGVVEGLAAIKLVGESWGGEGGGDSCVPRCKVLSRDCVEEGVEGEGRGGAPGFGEKYWQFT